MLRFSFILVLLLQAVTVFAQETRGKVYANNQVLEDVFVLNITQNKSEQTDEKGDFAIAANVGDSLVVTASFYATQRFKVEPYQLEEIWVVELKEDLNQLDEVRISSTKNPEIDTDFDKTSENIMASIKKDNPSGYNGNSGGNLMGLVSKAAGLLKKNDKKPRRISYKDLRELFKNDPLFTAQLLSEQLNIPEQHHNLFLEYCSTKYLKIELLEQDRHFELLDRLVNYSKQFLNNLEESKDSK